MTFRPAIQTVYEDEAEVMRVNDIMQEILLRWRCTQVGETMLTQLNFILKMEPVIEASYLVTKYLRPSLWREVKMLMRVGANPTKAWPAMMDSQKCEQITSTINLVLSLRRQNIHHEGLEAALSSWVRKHQ